MKAINPKQLGLADQGLPTEGFGPGNWADTNPPRPIPEFNDPKPVNPPVKPPVKPIDSEKTREELLLDVLPPHIDPNSPAFKEDLAKVDQAAKAEAAREKLGWNDDDFDWNTDDSIILKEQRATAAYHNKGGELVIRQKACWDEEGDIFILVAPENCDTFIDRLTDIMRIPSMGRR
jgi:hypothetical protein